MAGPYRVASASGGQVVLERNPNYTGDRPRRIARIVYTTESSRRTRSRASSTGAPTTSAATHRQLRRGRPTRARRRARHQVRPGEPSRSRGQRALRAEPRSRGSTGSRSTRSDRSSATSACGAQPPTRSIGARSRRSSASSRPTASSPRPSAGLAANIAYPDEPDLAAARRLAGPGARPQGDPLLLRRSREQANRGDRPLEPRRDRHRRAHRPVARVPDRPGDEATRCRRPPAHLALRRRRRSRAVRRVRARQPLLRARILARRRPARARSRALAGRAEPRGSRTYARLEKTLVRDAVPVAVYASGVNPEFFSARVGCKVSQGALELRRPRRALPARLISRPRRSSR